MPDITINITTAQVQRVQDAFTYKLQPVDGNGDPRQADVNDVKDYMIRDLKQFVMNAERAKARDEIVGDVELDLT